MAGPVGWGSVWALHCPPSQPPPCCPSSLWPGCSVSLLEYHSLCVSCPEKSELGRKLVNKLIHRHSKSFFPSPGLLTAELVVTFRVPLSRAPSLVSRSPWEEHLEA